MLWFIAPSPMPYVLKLIKIQDMRVGGECRKKGILAGEEGIGEEEMIILYTRRKYVCVCM